LGGALVFHRPVNGMLFQRNFRRQKFLLTRMVADCDDLVFDPDMAEFSPGVVNGIVGLEQTREMFANNRAALQKFSRISTSTEPLAEEMQRVFPKAKIIVIPNAVYHGWLDLPEPLHPRPKILTYLPGTRSHDRDFQIVAPVLEDLLSRHPEIRLHVTGPLSFGVRAREGQIMAKEKVEFSIYHERVAEGRVNLAPLEESPFNRCKSALKILEAGFFGIPTVCSDFPDARRFLGAGAHIARSPEDWRAALERLLFDEETYRALAGVGPGRGEVFPRFFMPCRWGYCLKRLRHGGVRGITIEPLCGCSNPSPSGEGARVTGWSIARCKGNAAWWWVEGILTSF
jgi:glycosyltransferase involved in cell wall biosynthesis